MCACVGAAVEMGATPLMSAVKSLTSRLSKLPDAVNVTVYVAEENVKPAAVRNLVRMCARALLIHRARRSVVAWLRAPWRCRGCCRACGRTTSISGADVLKDLEQVWCSTLRVSCY